MSGIETPLDLERALKKASKDEERVVSLLDENRALLDDDGGVRLLGWAVQHKRPHLVKALVQRGVDIEAARVRGWTALQWAADAGHENMARLLLELGADAIKEGEYNRKPLHYAIENRNVRMVKLFLEHMGGQAMEETDERSYMSGALAVAASCGSSEVVAMLLDHGADARGMPLMLAAQRGSTDGVAVVKVLLKHLQPQDVNTIHQGPRVPTALHRACEPKNYRRPVLQPGIVAALLLAGANPTITNRFGRTPRYLATACRDPRVRAEMMAVFEVSPFRCPLFDPLMHQHPSNPPKLTLYFLC
jgi:ankyrin repeat protein